MKRLLEFFEQSTREGGLSATRLVFISWSLLILFNCTFMSIYHKQLQPIDPTIVTAFGVITTGAVFNKGIEMRQPQ